MTGVFRPPKTYVSLHRGGKKDSRRGDALLQQAGEDEMILRME